MAKEFHIPLKNGLPDVSFQFIRSFSKSRITYKNQWASHPALEERKNNLSKLATDVIPVETYAWELFADKSGLQEQMTSNLLKNAKITETIPLFDGDFFEDWYSTHRKSFSLPEVYNGYYDNRFIEVKEWEINENVCPLQKPLMNYLPAPTASFRV